MAIEGTNEIHLCLQTDFKPRYFLFEEADEAFSHWYKTFSLGRHSHIDCVALPSSLFRPLVYRKGVRNALLVGEPTEQSFIQKPLGEAPLVLIIDGVEKPSNLGAILRTANAMGVDACILTHTKVDIYHPNVIRASMGAVFDTPVASLPVDDAYQWLCGQNVSVYVSQLRADARPIQGCDLITGAALVVGAEDRGVHAEWLSPRPNVHPVYIPMYGRVDSLNVAQATAMLLYEARRQRGKGE